MRGWIHTTLPPRPEGYPILVELVQIVAELIPQRFPMLRVGGIECDVSVFWVAFDLDDHRWFDIVFDEHQLIMRFATALGNPAGRSQFALARGDLEDWLVAQVKAWLTDNAC